MAEKVQSCEIGQVQLFFRFVLCYLVLSLLLTAFVRQQGVDIVVEAAVATYSFAADLAKVLVLMIVPALLVVLVAGWKRLSANVGLLGYALVASALLQTAFSFTKLNIPLIVPFYADPALAEADRWLHGGTDPWVLAHRIGAGLPVDLLLPLYYVAWAIPALGLAVILAVADPDPERKVRFLVLYLFCWVVIGNLAALLGSSVGPVFYDAAYGGDRFAGLQLALRESGIAESRVGVVQEALWRAYAERGMAIGSGISAFPSVHVGIATLTALYLMERGRWLAVPGLAFLSMTLFLSVYTGYHYALDGYASIAAIVGLWALLRRSTGPLRLPQARATGPGAASLLPPTPR